MDNPGNPNLPTRRASARLYDQSNGRYPAELTHSDIVGGATPHRCQRKTRISFGFIRLAIILFRLGTYTKLSIIAPHLLRIMRRMYRTQRDFISGFSPLLDIPFAFAVLLRDEENIVGPNFVRYKCRGEPALYIQLWSCYKLWVHRISMIYEMYDAQTP